MCCRFVSTALFFAGFPLHSGVKYQVRFLFIERKNKNSGNKKIFSVLFKNKTQTNGFKDFFSNWKEKFELTKHKACANQ
jgi:hypothetical protein